MANLKPNPAAMKNRKSWSSKDDAVLIQMVMANKQSDEIAQILGRTVNAVLCRKSKLDATKKLGIRLKSTRGKELLAPRNLYKKENGKSVPIEFKAPGQTQNPNESANAPELNFEDPQTHVEERPVGLPAAVVAYEGLSGNDFSLIAEIAKRTGTTITITFNGK
jgi:hypothetical protein